MDAPALAPLDDSAGQNISLEDLLPQPLRYFMNIPELEEEIESLQQSWRTKDKKVKTLTVGLVLCLHIGVVPTDAVRTNPCAKLQCWIDPDSTIPSRAIEMIGNKLATQYLSWQPKAKCRQCLDPTVEDFKRLCMALRRRAKDEPALLHYNGHGVPKPTAKGEIWVFNKNFTQYMPVSVYDIQTWMGSPSIFVYDCSGAGLILESFEKFAQQRKEEHERRMREAGGRHMPRNVPLPVPNCIQMAACRADETLHTRPDLPADLFTSCLTTPIRTALRWVFVTRTRDMLPGVTLDMIERIPGQINNRRTMLGQLNWIFTTITDSIAWNVLPTETFHSIFRNDLLVAALFRNFLLASRIMRSVNCTPMSVPELPSTHDHQMWDAWDMAVDYCLAQLPGVLAGTHEFQPCLFFPDQLTAFETWLDLGGSASDDKDSTPEQLPVVLQVLLSQQHRCRALSLLDRFLNFGPWAVHKALSVGIFPYVFKLLGTATTDSQALLISIWAKILAVDHECKHDLLKPPAPVIRRQPGGAEKAFVYFLRTMDVNFFDEEIHAKCAYVLALFLDDNPKGQTMALDAGLLPLCLKFADPLIQSSRLRQWICFVIAKQVVALPEARKVAVQLGLTKKLLVLLQDPVSQVRAAAAYALGALYATEADSAKLTEADRQFNVDSIGTGLLVLTDDASHAVRTELAAALSPLIVLYQADFIEKAAKLKEDGSRSASGTQEKSSLARILRAIFTLAQDPLPVVAQAAASLLAHLGIKAARKRHSSLPSSGQQGRHTAPQRIDSARPGVMPVPQSQHGSGGNVPAAANNSFAGSSPVFSPSRLSYVQHTPRVLPRSREPERGQQLRHLIMNLTETTRAIHDYEQGLSRSLDLDDSSVRAQLTQALEFAPSLAPLLMLQGSTGSSSEPECELTAANLSQVISALQSLLDFEMPTSSTRLHLVETRFFSWCCKVFCKWSNEGENQFYDDAELSYHRLHAQEDMRQVALDLNKPGVDLRLNEQIFHTPTPRVYNHIAFLPYDPYLVGVHADSGHVSVHRVDQGSDSAHLPVTFAAGIMPGTRVTALRIANEDSEPVAMLGSSDGVVRLWGGWSEEEPKLLTSWRAVSKLRAPKEGSRGAGLVMDWHQQQGVLLASGDVQYIQVWDGEMEKKVRKLSNADINSCVTSLCVDKGGDALLAAGFGNGNVRLYDLRVRDDRCIVQHYEHHKTWVVGVHIQTAGQRCILSGGNRGDILWYDPRFPGEPVKDIEAYALRHDDSMNSFVVHDYAPVFATSTPNKYIKVFSLDGDLVTHHKHHTTFLGESIGPTAALAFHPLRPHLAAASYAAASFDSLLSIYSPPS